MLRLLSGAAQLLPSSTAVSRVGVEPPMLKDSNSCSGLPTGWTGTRSSRSSAPLAASRRVLSPGAVAFRRMRTSPPPSLGCSSAAPGVSSCRPPSRTLTSTIMGSLALLAAWTWTRSWKASPAWTTSGMTALSDMAACTLRSAVASPKALPRPIATAITRYSPGASGSDSGIDALWPRDSRTLWNINKGGAPGSPPLPGGGAPS
mmetsp:Transcript_9802/g.24960  ORF Transcript_9802/g.24960 Transcript_9802/m.24960 type:complete len:204 (+) Transcript_9802:479-1090(+)